MNRLPWELKRAQWRLGMFGMLAVLLIAGALVVMLAEALPLQRDIARREADLNTRAARLTQPPPPSPDEAVAPIGSEERYLVFLHSLHAIAAKNGVTIPQITYQLPVQDKDSPLRRYAVETTFSATYPQFRHFFHEVRTLPGARCERITLSRPNIGVTQLEVRLQCSFLVETAK